MPFCRARCAYCDFTSWAISRAETTPAAYEAGLERLLGGLSELGFLGHLETAYIGGGTPSVLGQSLTELVARVASTGDAPPEELTVEANPESATAELLRAVHAAGATRVSLGVQSLDDGVLALIGRLHTAEQALGAIQGASRAGLAPAADLMAGLPGEEGGALARHIECVIAAGATHVSVYPLEVHGGTALGRAVSQGKLVLPDEDAVADELEEAARTLEEHGFHRYEIASFARRQAQSAHNIGYWTGTPYLGLGTGAASMVPRALYERLREHIPSLPEAAASLERFRLTCVSPPAAIARAEGPCELAFEVEGLSARAALAEDLMLAVRRTRGIGPELSASAREHLGSPYEKAVERLLDLELLEAHQDGSLRPSASAWLVSNELFGALWELAPDEPVNLA